jgi:hypothetical protein
MNEKINTWRTLQDLPPAVTSFWCRFNRHTWTKWSDPVTPQHSLYASQTRVCIHCNTQDYKKWMIK